MQHYVGEIEYGTPLHKELSVNHERDRLQRTVEGAVLVQVGIPEKGRSDIIQILQEFERPDDEKVIIEFPKKKTKGLPVDKQGDQQE